MAKMLPRLLAFVVLIATVLHAPHMAIAEDLARGFVKPPDSAKPACFWWWFNCLVNKEGITRDLEEFHAKGIGSVLIWCTANGFDDTATPMPSGPKFLSPEWRELYRHCLREAARLDIEVSFNLCGGYCMGGPWIAPVNSGRWFLQSQLTVTGPRKFSGTLPLPGPRDGYPGPNFMLVPSYIDLPLEEVDYRDSAVVAFLEPEGEAARFTGDRLKQLAAKSNRLDADCFISAQKVMEQPLVPWTSSPTDTPIQPARVVDLTASVTPEGRLDWDVPPGRWTIVRTGHRMTGASVILPLPESNGLEVDWLDGTPVEQQFDNIAKILIADAGPLVGKTLKFFHDDSFEDGFPNWTDAFLQKFKAYRGYDATPYLPVFAGRIVGSAEVSDRFLYDYRKTVADCMADGHYKRFADSVARARPRRPERGGRSDLVRNHVPGWAQEPGALRPAHGRVLAGRSLRRERPEHPLQAGGQRLAHLRPEDGIRRSVHVFGQVSDAAPLGRAPSSLKPTADRAFCEGINRFVIHCTTATRPEDGKPGYEYGAGTHFNPNVTWWDKSGAWLAYFGRCQYLLQEGRFVADVLYYNGDWAPNLVQPKHVDPSLGPGYDYDVCNAEVLLTRLSVKDGRIALPDGMSYRLLVLPDSKRMPVEVVKKIRDLVEAGATVVGPKPETDPGLKDYPTCDAAVKELAAEVWGDCDGQTVKEHRFGNGRVVWNQPLRAILLADGVKPDFEAGGGVNEPAASSTRPAKDGDHDSKVFLDFIHRTIGDAEVYFVANRNNREEAAICTFRVRGRQPELWDPLTGEMRDAVAFDQVDGRTTVPLEFAPYGSLFVVFRKPIAADAAGKAAVNFPQTRAGTDHRRPLDGQVRREVGRAGVGGIRDPGRLEQTAGGWHQALLRRRDLRQTL